MNFIFFWEYFCCWPRNLCLLGLFAQNVYFAAFVHSANANEPPPDLQGKFVRIEGVYAKSLDAFGRVAKMASKILQRLGYRVLTVGNGPEALALWPQHRGKIVLLLTDMVMPGGMTGRELADCLLREAPGMPFIYSTGYSMDLIDSGANCGTQARCLFKPYDASALANAVNKVFANGN